jgi:hypothetical protein
MLENEETRILELLEKTDPTSKEYALLLNRLKTLKEISDNSFSFKSPFMIQAYTNLLGIASIILFERTGVITTKALNFVRKQ